MLNFLLLLAACGDECDGPFARCGGNVAENCGFRWDNELSGHFELDSRDCGGGFCQASSALAFCALDPAPDPACPLPEAPTVARCVEGEVVTWSYGYRVASEPCADGAVCADVDSPGFDPTCDTTAFCSTGPDALCGPGVFTACEDAATILYCSCGYRVDAHACVSPGPRCTLVDVEGALPQGACR